MDADVDRLVSSEARLADECFRRVEYQGDAHKQVYRRICYLRFIADRSRHYSPYAAFVQSSGVGKTRCVMEMSTLGIYICYCSLAGQASSAYPPRTGFLADKLVKSFTELEMVLYLKAWLVVLGRAIRDGVSAVQWKESQLPGSGDTAKAVLDEWEALIAAASAKAYAEDFQDRDLVNTSMLEEVMEDVEKALKNVERASDAMMSTDDDEALASHDPRVMFVFDEARGLHALPSETAPPSTSPFSQLRRALRTFFDSPAFFALMLDTSAKISNLLPRKSDEDSSRALKVGIHLLPPIYYLPTLRLNLPEPGMSLEEYTHPARWMKYGRPLWAARMVREGQHGRVLKKLLEFAKQKLMGPDFNKGPLTESQAMALLAAATGLQVCPRSPLAETMAASHMNIVLRVTKDRSRIFVALPAEPILSEAAASLLRDEQVKRRVLMHMEAACLAGYATAGPRGEFVAKFLLSAAVWSYAEKSKGTWYLRAIKVRDFFRQLLLNDSNRKDATTQQAFTGIASQLPEGGIVFFHSFVVVGQVPDAAMLGKCFVAGHAMMYQADNTMPGADLLIPIWTSAGMTCAVISVKNVAKPGWMETLSLDTLRSEFTKVEVAPGLCVVTVLMSLREPAVKDPVAWLKWDQPDPQYLQMTLYGIDNNYGYLSPEVKALLKAILVTRPDPVEGASPEEKEWVVQMMPYQYEEADRRFAFVGNL